MNDVFETLVNHAGDDHMSGYHMTDWWGFPFSGLWMIVVWLIFVGIAFLVYRDAEKRGMNGPLWFILTIIPWLGIVSIIAYLILRREVPSEAASSRFRNSEPAPGSFLDERYALGGITRKEYLGMKRDLRIGDGNE